jgi:GTP-binding protein YchF
MNLSVGIVGLPNVGKSTLFNTLLKKQQALAANYPFATIEPNVGIVPVPDERLGKLAEITKREEQMANHPPIKPATVEFVDIAGLVKGASEGAGLGNKFLSHIREVRIIAHVVRAFEDGNIVKEGAVDPVTDYQTIRTELALADLQAITNFKQKTKGAAVLLDRIEEALNNDKKVSDLEFSKEDAEIVKSLNLLSSKPEIIVLNVSEAEYTKEGIENITKKYSEILGLKSAVFTVICAKIEEELAALSDADQVQYLSDLGITESGLSRLIKKAYSELGLISFLTCGEKEVRAWTIKKDTNAPEAAGEIHTDFIKNFIKAEIVSYDDFVDSNGWKGARAGGKARMEGKDYVIADGDVVEFKIGR